MLVLTDNDVGGAVTVLRRILESAEWTDLAAPLSLRFLQLPDLDLPRDASDADVWQASQKNDAVLITANRASGDDALEQVILDSGDVHTLPVITLGDPQRVRRDRDYAEECVFSLLDLLERIEGLRGTGRLFIP
jgi:predicted nuclease of predicted toxin-antitoxin system